MKTFIVIFMFLINSIHLFSITLEEAKKVAIENNKSYLSSEEDMKEAKWNKINALTQFFPKISLNESIIQIDKESYELANKIINIPVVDSSDLPTGNTVPLSMATLSEGMYRTTYTTDLTVQQPIFNGGRLIFAYEIAKLTEDKSILNNLSEKNNLDYSVAESYFNILKFQELLEIYKKQLLSSKSQLEKVEQKYDLGMAKLSDKLQWQLKVKNDKINLDRVKNSLLCLKTGWKNLLGIQARREIPLPEEIDFSKYYAEIENLSNMPEDEKKVNLKILLNKTLKNNPEIKTLQITKDITKKNYNIAIGNFLPSINLQYARQIEQDDKFNFKGDETWNITLLASLPLFHSGSNLSTLKKRKHQYNKTNLLVENAVENILLGSENTFYNLINKAKIITSSKLVLKNAKENYEIVNNYYEQDMVTNSELLDAEVMLYTSKMELTSAYYDYILAKYLLMKYINEDQLKGFINE